MLDLSDLEVKEETKKDQESQGIFLDDLGEKISDNQLSAILDAKKYDMPFTAAALGAARGFSFGASDLAAKAIGLEEEAKKIQQYNPEESFYGELGGAAGTAFFGPGAALTRGALAVTGAKALPTLGRVAAAGAIEGGAYGLGTTISQQALGSPNDLAEDLVANVGIGAVLGGAFSSAAYGVGKGYEKLKKQATKFLKGDDAVSKWFGPQEDFFAEERAKQAVDLESVKAAAAEEEIPLTPGMVNDSQVVRGLESSLEQSGTKFGSMVREQIAPTRKGAQKAATKVLDDLTEKTEFEIGEQIKGDLVQKAHEIYDPVRTLYTEIGEETKNINITPELRGTLVNRINQWANSKTLARSEARSAAKDAVANLSEDIYMPIDKIKDIASDLGGRASVLTRAGDSKQALLINDLQKQVNNFYERQIRRASIEAAMAKPEGEVLAKDFLSKIKTAKKGWREFKVFLEETGAEAGLGKIKSFTQFLDRIESIDSEKLVKNLFDKKDVRSIKFFSENFPEQFDQARRIQISKIRNAVKEISPEGYEVISIPKLIRKANDYSPEALELLLGKDKVKTLKNLEKIAVKFPKKMGPSGTPQGINYSLLTDPRVWFRDAANYAAYRGSKLMTEVGDNHAKLINSKINTWATNLKKPVIAMSTISATQARREYQKNLDEIKQTAIDPSTFIKTMEENTKGVADLDPDLHQAIINKGFEAASFLKDKAPKNPFEGSLFKSKIPWTPSDQELSKFNRYLKAVDDPLSILDDLNQNLLTPEAVEAVKIIYPKIHQDICAKAIDEVSTNGSDLSFVKQLQLGLLLGQPVSNAEDKTLVMRLQQGAQAAGAKEDLRQNAAPVKNKKMNSDFLGNQMGQSEQLIRSRGQNP